MAQRVRHTLIALVAMTLLLMLVVRAQQPEPLVRPRVVITADPELDDTNTLIRALLILEATDEGTSTLTRYQRVIVTVRP
jgi:cellulose-binding protein